MKRAERNLRRMAEFHRLAEFHREIEQI